MTFFSQLRRPRAMPTRLSIIRASSAKLRPGLLSTGWGSLLLILATLLSIAGHAAIQDEHNAFIEIYAPAEGSKKINIAVKDNIDIADKVTSAGSIALAGNVAKTDAFLINKLKQNGYHVYGKANLSEWANFRSINSVSGWSSLGGQTTHSRDPQFNPCGSSSGSAVAVAAGIVDISIGTETNGSITCPASVNGVVGMKPTLGLVSRSGIIPIAAQFDTAGPIGANVAIVAQALADIAGIDPNDSSTAEIPQNLALNFADLEPTASLTGKRFGLLDSGSDDANGKLLLAKIKTLINNRGGTVVSIEDTREYPGEASFFIMQYEFKKGLEAYLATATEPKKSLAEIIAFNRQHEDKAMPYFKQEILEMALASAQQSDTYANALQQMAATKRDTLALMKRYDLDAFVGLTRGPAWLINYQGGDDAAAEEVPSFGNGSYAAITGLPHVTVPAFEINGFPVGISVIGRPWSDKAMLQYAAVLENEIDRE